MSWQDVGVLIAMVGVIGGFVLTWRGQKQDKELSEASASRSEAAARLTADNTERVLLALETIAAKDVGGASGTPLPAKVRWSLLHHQGDTYRLENVGGVTAYDVKVTAHDTMIARDLPDGVDIAEGEAAVFLAAMSLGTQDRNILVTWLDYPSAPDRREWRYPLPPRPPR